MRKIRKQTKREASLEQEEKSLIANIYRAFAYTRYPGDNQIIEELNVYDGTELWQKWRGRKWRRLPLQLIIQDKDHMPFFSAAGFHYYLPAWLIASIKYWDLVDTLHDNLLFSLAPPDQLGKEYKNFEKKVSLFTKNQQKIILQYLQNDEHPSFTEKNRRKAIEFWKRKAAENKRTSSFKF